MQKFILPKRVEIGFMEEASNYRYSKRKTKQKTQLNNYNKSLGGLGRKMTRAHLRREGRQTEVTISPKSTALELTARRD